MSGTYLTNESLRPRDAYIILTLKCNLRCPHCYLSAGPNRKKSMPMEFRKKVMQEIAENKIENVCISGGEPTIEREELIETLKYAIEEYEKCGIKPRITLQTNALYLTKLNDVDVKKELEKLKSAGVWSLDIASMDNHHGVSFSELDRIAKIGVEIFGKGKITMYNGGRTAVPIGRAKWAIKRNLWATRITEYTACSNCITGITVNVEGKVYPCSWQATSAMGDLSQESLIEIINRARKQGSIFRKLAERGGFSFLNPEQDLEISEEAFKKLLDKFGICGACAEYWRWRVP